LPVSCKILLSWLVITAPSQSVRWLKKASMNKMKGAGRGASRVGSMDLSHLVTASPHKKVRGAKTKTDMAPMSTPTYSKHIRNAK